MSALIEKFTRPDYAPHIFLVYALPDKYIHGETTFHYDGIHLVPRTIFRVYIEKFNNVYEREHDLICTTPHLEFALSRFENPELVTE